MIYLPIYMIMESYFPHLATIRLRNGTSNYLETGVSV